MRRAHGALVAATLVLIAGCGSTAVRAHLTATTTLISDARHEVASATTYHLVVKYREGFTDFAADLHVRLPSDAVGTVAVDGSPVQVLQTAGHLYLQGRDFLAEYGGAIDSQFGSRWVLVTHDLVQLAVLELDKLTALPAAFLDRVGASKRSDDVAAAAEVTAQLQGSWGSVYITEEAPHRLVKVETPDDYPAPGGLSGVSFEILEYGDPVDVRQPASFADVNDPATLPPDYDLPSVWHWGTCIYSEACGFTATVENYGGTYPTTTSTYLFILETDPGLNILGECAGSIPLVGHGGTVGIGCLVTTAAYRQYRGGFVRGRLLIDNAAFDG